MVVIGLAAMVGLGLAAPEADAKGLGPTAAPDGVTVAGSPYRYVSLHPNTAGAPTVVERIDRDGGRVDRWWYLRGNYYIPAVAYDGSGGGLSVDGRSLVLTRFKFGYPPRETRFAVLDTALHLRPHRHEQNKPRHAISRIDLPGYFSFDAISPDGSTIYLIEHGLSADRKAVRFAEYEVRAFDVESGRLLPEPIVDPDEPEERMEGLPVSRATSPDGRWAYTLYDGNGGEPFVHALDTVRGRAVCVDLPQLWARRNLFLLRMRLAHGGGELEVFSSSTVQGAAPSPPLLSVDTKTFAVQRPSPVATASSKGSPPWLPIGVAAAILGVALIWILGRRKRNGQLAAAAAE
jgi:hypothetical protein